MYRIVLIGSDGPNGQRLAKYLSGQDRVILNVSYADIIQNSCSWLQYKISALGPDLVISALDLYNEFAETFYPGFSLDTETHNHTLQDLASAIGKGAAFAGSPVIWLSDAEVFGSSDPAPYQKCHSPAPTTGFGSIALSAERLILELTPASVVLRTQWISGFNITGFFQSMLMLERFPISLRHNRRRRSSWHTRLG
jgi:dTDP-4-dehydrorhamnose reductase